MKSFFSSKKNTAVTIISLSVLLIDVWLWARNPLGRNLTELNNLFLMTAIIMIILDVTFLVTKKRWEGWEKKERKEQDTSWWGVVAGLIFMALYFISL